MELNTVRYVVLSLLLCGTLFFGFLPIRIRPFLNACECDVYHSKTCATKKQRLAICFLIFFGGGVLLSTCLVRLLHETREGFDEILTKCLKMETGPSSVLDTDVTFTSGEADEDSNETDPTIGQSSTNASGFQSWSGKRNLQRRSVIENESISYTDMCRSNIVNATFPLQEFITASGFFLIYFIEELIKLLVKRYQSAKIVELADKSWKKNTTKGSPILQNIRKLTRPEGDSNTAFWRHELANNAIQNSVLHKGSKVNFAKSLKDKRKSTNDLNYFYGQNGVKDLNIEGLDDFVTVLALSFNSVFEGFAAGFQHSQMSTWMLFVAIALHKFVSAFLVCLETLNKGGRKTIVVLYVIIFSFMSPIGMLAATLAHSSLEEELVAISVLNALSVGTLLYVALYEMLKQRKDFAEISGFSQFLVLLFGFISMSGVEYFYIQEVE